MRYQWTIYDGILTKFCSEQFGVLGQAMLGLRIKFQCGWMRRSVKEDDTIDCSGTFFR